MSEPQDLTLAGAPSMAIVECVEGDDEIGVVGRPGRAGEVRRQRPGGRDQGAVARSGERER